MSWSKTFFAALVAGVVVAIGICGAIVMKGLPEFGTPKTYSTWSVYSCPDAAECEVPVRVTNTASGCTIDIPDFIDRNPNQKKQTIVWTLAQNEINFKDPGITITQGTADVDDVSKAKKVHKKKFKKQDPDRSFILYDVLLEFEQSTGAAVPCKIKGPAITNRG